MLPTTPLHSKAHTIVAPFFGALLPARLQQKLRPQGAVTFPVRVLYNSFNVFIGKLSKFETQLPNNCIPAAFKLCPPLTPPACKAGMFSPGTQEALLA